MASYTVVIPDEQENCITAARAMHNKNLPKTVPNPDDPEGAEIPNPAIITDNAGYMTFVMQNAATSYCTQYPLAPLIEPPEPTPAPSPSPAPAAMKTTTKGTK